MEFLQTQAHINPNTLTPSMRVCVVASMSWMLGICLLDLQSTDLIKGVGGTWERREGDGGGEGAWMLREDGCTWMRRRCGTRMVRMARTWGNSSMLRMLREKGEGEGCTKTHDVESTSVL